MHFCQNSFDASMMKYCWFAAFFLLLSTACNFGICNGRKATKINNFVSTTTEGPLTTINDSPATGSCGVDEWQCSGSGTCINANFDVCDFQDHCGDGTNGREPSDENTTYCQSNYVARCAFDEPALFCDEWFFDTGDLPWRVTQVKNAPSYPFGYPPFDHTKGTANGHVLLLKYTKNQASKVARYTTSRRVVIASDADKCALRFYLYISGTPINIGSVSIFVRTAYSPPLEMKIASYSSTTGWMQISQMITTGLHVSVNQPFELVILGTTGIGYNSSAIAVDDISLTPGCQLTDRLLPGQSDTTTTATTPHAPICPQVPSLFQCADGIACYSISQHCNFMDNCLDGSDELDCTLNYCDFDGGDSQWCGWSNAADGVQMMWTWRNTAINDASPSCDYTSDCKKGGYLTASGGSAYNDRAVLRSLRFNAASPACTLRFAYYAVNSPDQPSTLDVFVKTSSRRQLVFQDAAGLAAQWKIANVSINSAEEFEVEFEVVRGNGRYLDISVDAIRFLDCAPSDQSFVTTEMPSSGSGELISEGSTTLSTADTTARPTDQSTQRTAEPTTEKSETTGLKTEPIHGETSITSPTTIQPTTEDTSRGPTSKLPTSDEATTQRDIGITVQQTSDESVGTSNFPAAEQTTVKSLTTEPIFDETTTVKSPTIQPTPEGTSDAPVVRSTHVTSEVTSDSLTDQPTTVEHTGETTVVTLEPTQDETSSSRNLTTIQPTIDGDTSSKQPTASEETTQRDKTTVQQTTDDMTSTDFSIIETTTEPKTTQGLTTTTSTQATTTTTRTTRVFTTPSITVPNPGTIEPFTINLAATMTASQVLVDGNVQFWHSAMNDSSTSLYKTVAAIFKDQLEAIYYSLRLTLGAGVNIARLREQVTLRKHSITHRANSNGIVAEYTADIVEFGDITLALLLNGDDFEGQLNQVITFGLDVYQTTPEFAAAFGKDAKLLSSIDSAIKLESSQPEVGLQDWEIAVIVVGVVIFVVIVAVIVGFFVKRNSRTKSSSTFDVKSPSVIRLANLRPSARSATQTGA